MTPARYARLLRDPRWQRRRLAVFRRDRWQCQDCRATHRELHAHHLWYVVDELPWQTPLDALVTLCKACHTARHRKTRAKVTGARRRLTTKRKR